MILVSSCGDPSLPPVARDDMREEGSLRDEMREEGSLRDDMREEGSLGMT